MDWGSLWQREDQRAAELISKDPEGAAQLLQSPEWLGSALYRAERFDEGAKAFSGADTALADYNRGNALARAGKLQEALKAYDSALDRNPDMEDARVNRQLVADLLKQQEEENSSQDQGSGDQQQEKNSDSSGENQNSQGSQSAQNSQNPDGEPEQSQGSPQEQEQSGGQEASGEQQPGDASENSDTSAQAAGAEPGGKEAQAPAPVSETSLTQSQEQSLRRVPDNPGGLLQRKFLQQYQERQTPSDEGDTPW